MNRFKICYPGDTNRFTARATNNLTEEVNFTIDLDFEILPKGLPTDWMIDFNPKNFSLTGKESKEIIITITTNNLAQGHYAIFFNFTSLDNLSKNPAQTFCTLNMKPFYKPEYAGSFTVYAQTNKTVNYCYFNLRLKNEGLREDTISGDIKSVESPLSSWWDSATPYAALEHEKQSAFFILKVRIPARTTMGSYRIVLYANSSNDPGATTETTLTLIIERFVDFTSFFSGGNIQNINPSINPNLDIELNIENIGNADDEFEIKLNSTLRYFWNSSLTSKFEKIGVISKDGIGQLLINLKVNLEEIYGDYDINFEIRSINDTLIKKTVLLYLRVERFYGLRLTYHGQGQKSVKPVYGDEKVVVPIGVENNGNTIDIFILNIPQTFFNTKPNAYEWVFDFYSDIELKGKIGSIQQCVSK